MPSASVVVRDVFDQPVDGVVGVSSLVDRVRLGAIPRSPGHHELAFGIVPPANVLEDENKPLVSKLLIAVLQRSFRPPIGEPVRRSLDQ